MQYKKSYEWVRFSTETIREASNEFRRQVDPEHENELTHYLKVELDEGEWSHDSVEEFFADYRRSTRGAYFIKRAGSLGELKVSAHHLAFSANPHVNSEIEVSASDRTKIAAVMDVFERNVTASRIPKPPSPPSAPPTPPKVFVGHGHADYWRDLKDHLQDQHGYEVSAYEIGARAGHEVRDILEEMLRESSFAVLVMSGEDKMVEGELHPRLNVVHELGLFQGRLGFGRAIMLLEEGTAEFSNIDGVHQIRFSKGNIKETYGDVLATLRREFPVPS